MVLGGRDAKQGLLMTLLEMSNVQSRAVDLARRDIDYRVVATTTEFGALEEMSAVGHVIDAPWLARGKCYEVLPGRDVPCADCPVRGQGPWPRTVVRRRGDGS